MAKQSENIGNEKKLKSEILSLDSQLLSVRKKIQELEEQGLKNSKEYESLREKELKDQRKLRDTEKELEKLRDKKLEQEQELKTFGEDHIKSMAKQKALMDSQSKTTKDILANNDFSAKLNDDILNKIENSVDLLKEQGSLSSAYVRNLQEAKSFGESISNIQSEIAKQADKAAAGEYTAVDLSQQKLDYASLLEKLQKEKNNMSVDERINTVQMLRAYKQAINQSESMNKALEESAKTAGKVLGVFDSVTNLDIKGALIKGFGLDDIQEQVKKKLGGSLVNIFTAIRGEGGLVGGFKAAGQGLGDLVKMAPKLLTALGIGAIVALGSFLIKTFLEADKEVAQLGKDFGISKNEAKELHHTAVDVANEMKIVGINSEQVAKGLKTASENLGGMDLTGAFNSGNKAVQQMVKDTTILTEKFGLSGEEAGNLNNIAAISGKSVGEMSMMATKLGNGIFSAKESMKILAGIPKSVVSSMSKMPEAMIKTAMHAKLLGMNMKQIADIGRKSLDIEESLEAEMEARAILGKDINLDKMRAAALDGDQETVMNELLNAAGSMNDFNKMNVIQKEALAKAAGMEVDQLAEMLGKQEELNKAGLSQTKLQELQSKNAADLAAEAAGTNDANKKAYIEKLAAEKKSEETQAAMADLMKRIQELAVKLVTPIMDMVDGLMNGKDGANALDGILNLVSGTIKGIVPFIKIISTTIGYLIKPLTWILGAFSSTEETTEGVAKGVEKVSGAIKPVEAGFGNVLGVVTAIGGLFAGKALLGKGLDMLKGKAGDLGSTLVSKVGGPLGKIGGKLFGGGKKEEAGGIGGGDKSAVGEAEKGKNMVSGILDKMKSIIDSIKGVVQSAIGFVRDVGKDLLATLNDIVKGIGDILKTGADIIVNVGTTLAEGAMKILNIIMDGLASAAKRLPDIMGALGKAVVAFFEPLASLVNPMVIAGIAIFTGAMIGLGYAFKLLGEGIGAAAPGIKTFFEGVGVLVESVGEAISKVIETITTSIIRLQDIDGGKLLTTAAGIVAIGGAMAALGAGKAAEGFGSFVGAIFGGGDDPFEKLISFSDRMNPEKLVATANGMKVLGDVFKSVADSVQLLASSLDKIDLSKMDSALEKLKEAKELTDMSVGEGIAAAAESFVGGITSIFGSSEEQKTQGVASTAGGGGGKGGDKIDQVIGLLTQILSTTNQPTVIKFGDKTVEEIKGQLNFKKAYSIGIDNTYGRSI